MNRNEVTLDIDASFFKACEFDSPSRAMSVIECEPFSTEVDWCTWDRLSSILGAPDSGIIYQDNLLTFVGEGRSGIRSPLSWNGSMLISSLLNGSAYLLREVFQEI